MSALYAANPNGWLIMKRTDSSGKKYAGPQRTCADKPKTSGLAQRQCSTSSLAQAQLFVDMRQVTQKVEQLEQWLINLRHRLNALEDEQRSR